MPNKKTVALTADQYKSIIKIIKAGFVVYGNLYHNYFIAFLNYSSSLIQNSSFVIIPSSVTFCCSPIPLTSHQFYKNCTNSSNKPLQEMA